MLEAIDSINSDRGFTSEVRSSHAKLSLARVKGPLFLISADSHAHSRWLKALRVNRHFPFDFSFFAPREGPAVCQ